MNKLAGILTGFVALSHLFFMVLEMFLWQTSVGLQIFDMTPEVAAHSAILAKNQGLYNGFLAAGLIWSFFIPDFNTRKSTRTFFLVCIIAAGVFAASTAKFSILFSQALPALLALIAVRYSSK